MMTRWTFQFRGEIRRKNDHFGTKGLNIKMVQCWHEFFMGGSNVDPELALEIIFLV